MPDKKLYLNCLWAVKCPYTTVAVRDKGNLSSAGIFQTRWEGVFRCRRPHFLVQKNFKFSKLMVCPHGQGRKGSIFCDFERKSFMDSPLRGNISCSCIKCL